MFTNYQCKNGWEGRFEHEFTSKNNGFLQLMIFSFHRHE